MNHVTLHIVSSVAVDSCVSLTQGGIDSWVPNTAHMSIPWKAPLISHTKLF